MSLPREMIDELLSGYLDDILSGDERSRVEQMISDQPELAHELESLKKQRAEVKLLAEQTAASEVVVNHQFAESFPQAVVSAAVQRAREEGCDADHPLLREYDPKTIVSPAAKGMKWRVVTGAIVALAASIAIAIFAFPKQPNNIKTLIDPDSIADLDDDQTNSDNAFVPPPIVPDINSDPGSSDVMVADADNNATNQSPIEPVTPNEVSPNDPASDDKMIAAADPKDVDDAPLPQTIGKQVGTVAVIEIELTQAGRESNAFREALKAASITLGDSRQLTPELVAFVDSDLAEKELSSPDIVLLECAATKLDLLYINLYSDSKNIQSIHFGLTMNAPIVAMVDSVRTIDPTDVKHKPFGQPIVATTEQLTSALAQEIEGKSVTSRMKNVDEARKQAAGLASEGPNVIMPLLVLIR